MVDLEVHSPQRPRLVGVGQERALEAVDDDALELVGAEPEGARGQRDLPRHRGGRDQPRVGVERHPQPRAEVTAERVGGEAPGGPGLHVRGQAHLERDPVVVDVAHQVRVFVESGAVSDAVGAALVERLADAGRTERLPGVHGEVDVVLEHQLERRAMRLGRIVLLLTREIEAQHPAPLVGHRQFGERVRDSRTHRADPADDHPGREPELGPGGGEPGDHRLDDLGIGQAMAAVEHRRVAHLEVLHVLGRGVLGQLVSDPLERRLLLEDAQGEIEDLEIVGEAAGAPAGLEQTGERRELAGRQLHPLLVGQLEQGARTQAAVEVAVEVGLGQPADDRLREPHA